MDFPLLNISYFLMIPDDSCVLSAMSFERGSPYFITDLFHAVSKLFFVFSFLFFIASPMSIFISSNFFDVDKSNAGYTVSPWDSHLSEHDSIFFFRALASCS
jgi:hypothetical protein